LNGCNWLKSAALFSLERVSKKDLLLIALQHKKVQVDKAISNFLINDV